MHLVRCVYELGETDTMTMSKTIMSVVAIGLFGAALAQEETHVKIEYSGNDGDHDAMRIVLDSDERGFNLHDMQEGENRSVVDKEGRTILVTREADGFVFDVDGKSVKMPMLHGEHGTIAMVNGDHVEDVDVRVLHHSSDMATPVMGGTMIITPKPVDEATQQAIRSLLESAGHDSEVHFIDHESSDGGPHQVKVVKKVEVISD